MIETMTRIKRVYENKQDTFGTAECEHRAEYSPDEELRLCRYNGRKVCLYRRNNGKLICCEAGLENKSGVETREERELTIKIPSLNDRI
jgi:hypothetical protein